MKNLDLLKQQKDQWTQKLQDAVKNGDEAAFAEAFVEYTNVLQEAVLAEARSLVQATDNQILAGRGVRVLTSEENKYYQGLIKAMKSSNPKQALADFDVVLPTTVIDAVFEDIQEEHPLLNAIDFVPTAALIEMIFSTQEGRHLAHWGDLTDKIVKELTAGFVKVNLAQLKLSAFIPIAKAMLDLGPVWLDRYIRLILSEAIANGLEYGIINGAGAEAKEPIGMIRDLDGSITPGVGYPEKTAMPVTSFDPATYGELIALLSKNRNGLNRKVTEVLMVVNPVDYFQKVMPATTYLLPDGTYRNNVFPFPTRVVQSAYVDEGKAVFGIGKRYFAGLGTSKGGRVEYSDEYRFLEDERVYLTKLYGTGQPKDNTSFLVLNIQNLVPAVPDVHVTNDPLTVYPVYDARLASLTIGTLTLTPAFNKSVMVYTATTTDASNKITAVAKDGEAEIEILVNGNPHTNGTAATWDAGENTVEITVTSGTETETYTVTVTKS